MTKKRRLLIGLITLLLAGAGTVVVVYPVIAAAACPWCYGLSKAGPGVYVNAAQQGHRWFHEGFAVVLSDDQRYLPDGRCPVDEAGARTRVRAGTSAGQDFYRDSACVVHRWIAEHGGQPAVLDLIRRLEAGDEFDAVVSLT